MTLWLPESIGKRQNVFSRYRKIAKLLALSCLSVFLHGASRLPLDGFS
jgi:hypothetical protein